MSASTACRRRRQEPAGRRRRLRRGAGGRRRDHAGAGRRRADDDRLPAAQHAGRRLPPPQAAGPCALTIPPHACGGLRRIPRSSWRAISARTVPRAAAGCFARAQCPYLRTEASRRRGKALSQRSAAAPRRARDWRRSCRAMIPGIEPSSSEPSSVKSIEPMSQWPSPASEGQRHGMGDVGADDAHGRLLAGRAG